MIETIRRNLCQSVRICENPCYMKQGLNYYAYCGNNPTTMIDPDGNNWLRDWNDCSEGEQQGIITNIVMSAIAGGGPWYLLTAIPGIDKVFSYVIAPIMSVVNQVNIGITFSTNGRDVAFGSNNYNSFYESEPPDLSNINNFITKNIETYEAPVKPDLNDEILDIVEEIADSSLYFQDNPEILQLEAIKYESELKELEAQELTHIGNEANTIVTINKDTINSGIDDIGWGILHTALAFISVVIGIATSETGAGVYAGWILAYTFGSIAAGSFLMGISKIVYGFQGRSVVDIPAGLDLYTPGMPTNTLKLLNQSILIQAEDYGPMTKSTTAIWKENEDKVNKKKK